MKNAILQKSVGGITANAFVRPIIIILAILHIAIIGMILQINATTGFLASTMNKAGIYTAEANSLLAFFDVNPGLQIELIQPNEEPSTWRNFLNEHGEGMHHLAFQVKDSAAQVANAEKAGLRLVQHGTYGDGGGEYNYLEAPDLKCIIELLESYAPGDSRRKEVK